jgi:hypothetical protein
MRSNKDAEALRALIPDCERLTCWLQVLAGIGAALLVLELCRLDDRDEKRSPGSGSARAPGAPSDL